MRRRILSALLAAVMLSALALPISAAGTADQTEVAEVIGALNIMVGDETGSLNLGKTVTRAEFITMAVKATPQGDQVGEASVSPYPDVPRKHWAAGFVQAGVRAGLITGYLDGTFRPNNQITLAEGVTIVLKLLGYTSADFSGAYPTAQMALGGTLGLTDGLNAKNSGDILTRRDAMYLFYNLLSARTTSGQYYLTTLGYSVTASGEVDRTALMGQVMDGPIVAGDGWRDQIPFDMSGASVIRAGQSAGVGDIQSGDLIYWNEGMRRLWVYTDRLTGLIQALSPSSASPTSVTVAGRTYAIETDAATYQLSDMGGRRLGDTVTLVLGRNGGVAAVVDPVVGEQSKVGMVTAVSRASYADDPVNSHYDDTVTVLATDGNTYSYQWTTRYFEAGDLVKAVVADDGTLTLKRLSKTGLTGHVPADGSAVGSRPMAADVEIMDTYGETGIRVFPSRLGGASLTKENVLYYDTNPQGEIQHLILKEYTGDMHQYGIMTKVVDMTAGMNVAASYTMELNGQKVSFVSQGIKYAVQEGPFLLKGSVSSPDRIYQLKSSPVERISGGVIQADGLSFTIFDTMQVYEYRDNGYYLSNLDRVTREGYTKLTVWYDKTQSQGGCARILVAKP